MISIVQRRKNPKLFTRKNFPDEAREIVSHEKHKSACLPFTIIWKIQTILKPSGKWEIIWKNPHSFNWKCLDSFKTGCKLSGQISIRPDGSHRIGTVVKQYITALYFSVLWMFNGWSMQRSHYKGERWSSWVITRNNFPSSNATCYPGFSASSIVLAR